MTDAAPDQYAEQMRYYRLRYFAPLLIFLFALRFATLSFWLAMLVPIGYDVSFPESAVAMGAWKVLHGGAPYEDWRQWPHHFAPYGPMTYYLPGWIGRVFMPEEVPWNLFYIGRTLSLTCLAGICILLWRLCRRAGGERAFAAVCVAAFFTWDDLLQFLSSFRPDAPRAFFTMLAFALMWRRTPTPARCLGVWASLWVAFWYKATSWALPVAAVIWIARERGRGAAGLWFVGWALSGLIPALLLNASIDGLLFLNLVTGMDNGFDPASAAGVFAKYVPASAIMHVTAVWLSVRSLAGFRRDGGFDLLPLTILLTLFTTLIQSCKAGSDANYLIDLHTLSALRFSLWIRDVWRGRTGLTAARTESVLLLLLILPGIFNGVRGLISIRADTRTLIEARSPLPIARYVGRIEGEILTLLPNFAMIRPAPPTIMDHFHYQVMAERGRLDPRILLDRVEARRFAAVIMASADLPYDPDYRPNKFLGSGFVPALIEHYEVGREWGRFSIMVPKGSEGKTLPETGLPPPPG